MGKLKNYYQPEIERDTHACPGFNEWCEWLAATRNPMPQLDAYVTESFRRRLANAVYETKRKRGACNAEPYDIEFHVFELERVLNHLVNHLNDNQL